MNQKQNLRHVATVYKKGCGKVCPRTGHEGPDGLDEGGWSTPRPGRFTPGKDPAPIV